MKDTFQPLMYSKMFYEDNHIKIYNKDCRTMGELANESVQMVCCSPPYWGLRKYSGEQELIWGGDKNCEHQWQSTPPRRSRKSADIVNLKSKEATVGGNLGLELPSTNTCPLCGAWKGAYGLEPTPEIYIEHTIEILREIRRVLRKDGVVFWNIGDSYASSPAGNKNEIIRWQHGNKPESGMTDAVRRSTVVSGLKPKDLCLIPFRLAIAAQEDGWWVRSVIIWSKPNPMPESITDRPTESHEYILMLTKSKKYYWDADAVREPISESYADDKRPHGVLRQRFYPNSKYVKAGMMKAGEGLFPSGPRATGRNIRSVWEFPTQPYPEAHFAVFPEKLPELCIKAATPEVGCCSKCGSPWERIIEHHRPDDYDPSVVDEQYSQEARKASGHNGTNRPLSKMFKDSLGSYIETTGWQPNCKCNADKVPSMVLDPFAGAGTTLWVAKRLNRQAVGYEISQEYCRLAVDRCRQQVLI